MRFHRVSIATGDHLQTILSWERSESRGSAWNTQRFHRSASTKHNRVKSEVHFPDVSVPSAPPVKFGYSVSHMTNDASSSQSSLNHQSSQVGLQSYPRGANTKPSALGNLVPPKRRNGRETMEVMLDLVDVFSPFLFMMCLSVLSAHRKMWKPSPTLLQSLPQSHKPSKTTVSRLSKKVA